MSELKRRYPLAWPTGWKRSKTRVRADFGKVSTDGSTYSRKRPLSALDGAQRVMSELSALGVREDDVLISTNLRTRIDGLPRSEDAEPTDPGAVVYWQDKNGQQQCLPIDHYNRVADNLAAIAATLNAFRAVKRHGGGIILDRAIAGLRPELPEHISLSWRQVLEFQRDEIVTVEMIEKRFRSLARAFHPDLNPDRTTAQEHMSALNVARDEALKELAAPKEMHA